MSDLGQAEINLELADGKVRLARECLGRRSFARARRLSLEAAALIRDAATALEGAA